MESIIPGNVPAQIANLHTLFNIVTTLLLLPVGTWLGKIATFILKDKKDVEDTGSMHVQYLLDLKHMNADKLGGSAICEEGIKKELLRMMEMAKDNVLEAFDVFANGGKDKFAAIEKREEYVDFLNKEISKYITTAVSHENTSAGGKIFNALYSVTSNVERMSDHAINIAGYSNIIAKKNIVFSEQALEELLQMQATCSLLFDMLLEKPEDYVKWHGEIACMEQKIDDMTVQFRDNMYERIKIGKCSDEGSILFSEMLTDFERIGDHALNISGEMLKIAMVDY